jgi:hypothetical protein
VENLNKVIQELGLTQIETQQVSFKCCEGLLINFNYGIELTQSGQESQMTTLAEAYPVKEE